MATETQIEVERLHEEIQRLKEALKLAIEAADGWFDDSQGGECPGLDEIRKLIQ